MEEALWCNQYATLKTESIQSHTKSHRSPVSWSTGDSKMSPVTDIWYHRKFCYTQFYLFLSHYLSLSVNSTQSFYQQEVTNWQPVYSQQFQYISQEVFTQYVIFDSNTLNEMMVHWFCLSCLSLCTTLNSSENYASYITRAKSLLKVKSGILHFIHCWIVTSHIWGQC